MLAIYFNPEGSMPAKKSYAQHLIDHQRLYRAEERGRRAGIDESIETLRVVSRALGSQSLANAALVLEKLYPKEGEASDVG